MLQRRLLPEYTPLPEHDALTAFVWGWGAAAAGAGEERPNLVPRPHTPLLFQVNSDGVTKRPSLKEEMTQLPPMPRVQSGPPGPSGPRGGCHPRPLRHVG